MVTKDQCPECRAMPGAHHAKECPSTLDFATQNELFEMGILSSIEALHKLIDKHHWRILCMARQRFMKGYEEYGSTMYGWAPERRLCEILEELADAAVYHTSGELD